MGGRSCGVDFFAVGRVVSGIVREMGSSWKDVAWVGFLDRVHGAFGFIHGVLQG